MGYGWYMAGIWLGGFLLLVDLVGGTYGALETYEIQHGMVWP